MHRPVRLPVLAIALSALAFTLPAPASADPTSAAMGQIARAVEAHDTDAGPSEAFGSLVPGGETAARGRVVMPADGSDAVRLTEGSSTVTLDLPADGASVTADGTTLYDAQTGGADIAAQRTDEGFRALVHVDNQNAPERYDFKLGGDVVRLVELPNGGVAGIDDDGFTVGVIAAPWATDKNGTNVPTHYEIDGTTLTQVVEHRSGDYAYGITADPHWGWWHRHVDWSSRTANDKVWYIKRLGYGTSAAGIIVAMTGPVGVVPGGIAALFGQGVTYIADRIDYANSQSRGRGVAVDIGFRCVDVPFSLDPCAPALWIKPR